MHIDPLLPVLVTTCLCIFAIALALKRIGQPYVIGYLITGIVIGPEVMGVVQDKATLTQLGSIGVVLLLFFVGMEVSPKRLIADWKVSVCGTLLQILISVGCVWLLGKYLDWPASRIILLGFVISLSSTAVVIRLLQERGELESSLGGHVLGILLVQDVAIIPMLITTNLVSGESPSMSTVGLQLGGAILFVAVFLHIAKKGELKLGLTRIVGDDPEMHVFAGVVVCMGLAFLTGLLQLSTALGAFLGGIIINSAKETHWIKESLEPFRVVFVALFFVSIGMLVDLGFVAEEWQLVLGLTAIVMLSNTGINAIVLRLFGTDWPTSIYGATMLAPIGELSFVLASVGKTSGAITEFGYQATMATIAASLMLGPSWIALLKFLSGCKGTSQSE